MKITHKPEIDFLSIDFKDEIEARSYFQDGIIVRENSKGEVIGIDITDSTQTLQSSQYVGLQEACKLLGISESTMRRRIKEGLVQYTKPNKKDYRFKKSDILKLVS